MAEKRLSEGEINDYEQVTTGCLAIATTLGIRIVTVDKNGDLTMPLKKWSDFK